VLPHLIIRSYHLVAVFGQVQSDPQMPQALTATSTCRWRGVG
jgi:hypothetical protein